MRTKFREIVAQLSDDIQSGLLKPGDKLPTHRQLAYERGLSLGTATRVFSELDAMGLTRGEIGRGTFVRMNADARAVEFALPTPSMDVVDFSRNHLVLPEQDAIFANAVAAILADKDCDVLDYRNNVGSMFDRRSAWRWINSDRTSQLEDYASLAICSGGQHAIMLSLLACCHPGQVVAVEQHTYPVVRLVCDLLKLEVVEVKSDADGIDPNALEKLCQVMPIRALFCMPNVQNPTSVTMPLKRRHALAKILKANDIFAIEDDAYGFLLEKAPTSLSEIVPEHVFYTRTFSKSWAPGLRVCYLVSPSRMIKSVDRAQRASVWMSTPLMTSVATHLITSGGYNSVIEGKRKEVFKRQTILRRVFKGMSFQTDPRSMHVVLPIPKNARMDCVLGALKDKQIIASPIEQFAASHEGSRRRNGIRLCIGAPRNRSVLEDAFQRIRSVIEPL